MMGGARLAWALSLIVNSDSINIPSSISNFECQYMRLEIIMNQGYVDAEL